MNASRLQHISSSAFIFAVATIVTWVSFDQEGYSADAFLFPRLIAVFFISLAVWNLVRALAGMSKVGEGLDGKAFLNILPGLVVALVYVFFAAKTVGFYLSSTIVFLTVVTLYDPAPVSDMRAWRKRIIVTICFMLVMYGLFALLLKVQTPRGIWF